MNGMSHSVEFTAYLKGDLRVDGWKSSWRHDFERRYAEDKGKPQYVFAKQIKVRQERKPKAAPRICDLCPNVIGSRNQSVRCRNHGAPKAPAVKSLCPGCDTPVRSCPKYGICGGCYKKYRRLISQPALRTCDECHTRLRPNNSTGKCTKHALVIHKRKGNANRRAKYKALRTIQLAA